MKKFLCILLSLIMLCLTACNTGKPSGAESSTPKTEASSPSEETPNASEESSSSEETPKDPESSEPESSEPEPINWSVEDVRNLYFDPADRFSFDTPNELKAFFTQKNDAGVVYAMSEGALLPFLCFGYDINSHFMFCNKILSGEITLQILCRDGKEVENLGCLYFPRLQGPRCYAYFEGEPYFYDYYMSYKGCTIEYLNQRTLDAIEGKPMDEAFEIIDSQFIKLPSNADEFPPMPMVVEDIEMYGRTVSAMIVGNTFYFVWDNILVKCSNTSKEALKRISFTPVLLPD